jgi:hypothetical protein
MHPKLFEKVSINVKTTFGTVKVEFTVVDVQPNYHYALIAQHRIVRGQEKCDGSWILSDSIDLLDVKPISEVYHEKAE